MGVQTERRDKCLCYVSSIDFFISDSLTGKVKSIRKYLH